MQNTETIYRLDQIVEHQVGATGDLEAFHAKHCLGWGYEETSCN